MLRLLTSLAFMMVVMLVPVSATAQAEAGAAVLAESVNYLRPGDMLRLRIWREPEFSGEFMVAADGNVVLPRLGSLSVTEVHPDSLRPRLIRAYAEFLNNPTIEIMVLRRISVLGAVRNPGLYPVDPTMRLSDVLALAGGSTLDGKQGKIELRRDGTRIDADLAQTARIADLPIRSGDQLYVPQRGWLSRNTWLISTVMGATATLLLAATR